MDENVPDADPMVMYLVVRESLGMTPGKMGAQIGHGDELVMEEYHEALHVEVCGWDTSDTREHLLLVMGAWRADGHTKILLSADEKAWAKVKLIPHGFIVLDAGRTQVPAQSETVIAFAPMFKSVRPSILKRLRLVP